MGTHVFFEKDEKRQMDGLYGKGDTYYKFFDKTNKLLKMSRVLIKDNATELRMGEEKDIPGIKEQLTIKRTYEQALNLFLDPARDKPPRKIPDEFNCQHLIATTSAIVPGENNETTEVVPNV